MKKNFIYLLLLCSIIAQAQVTPSYPTIKLTKTVEGVKQDSLLVVGTDKIVKHIPSSKITSILEYTTASALPITGAAGKIYVTKDNSKIYRWNGTYYTELAITDISGKVDKVTGKSLLSDTEITRLATLSNYTHPANHPPSIITQDASNRFVTDAEKTAWNAKQAALGYTPENVANKSDSYTASSTTTYPNTKALVDGLSTKISGTGTTGRVQVSLGTGSIGNSSITDNGSVITTSLPIYANSFIKSTGSTNILLTNGNDITQASLPISTATQTALDLKANLASPTFTGVPTAPTPTTTTGIANKSYVDGLDSGNVKLTGQQSIVGEKTFANNIVLNGGVLTFLGLSSLQTGNPSIYRIGNRLALNVATGGKNVILEGNEIASSVTLNLQNSSGTIALTNNRTPITATSFINSTAPATNVLLAGGTTLANPISGTGTAGYLPKFTSAGVIGNSMVFDNGTNVGIGTINPSAKLAISDLVSTTSKPLLALGEIGYQANDFGSIIESDPLVGIFSMYNFNGGIKSTNPVFSWNRNGGNLLINTTSDNGVDKLQVNGSATFASTVTASTYTATSLPVFENNTAASSLAVGQFYRTSTGVLMVKF